MRILFFLLILSSPLTHAQDDCNCRSQLLRVDVESAALEKILKSSADKPGLTSSLDAFLRSEVFQKNIIRDWPMESMGFPFNTKRCEEEKKQGIAKYKDVDCKNTKLCSDPSISENVKNELCLEFPCAIILGSQNMSQCSDKASARPTFMHWPKPLTIKQLAMTPTSVTTENKVVKACFTLDKMELNASIDVEFQKDPQVAYPRLGMGNLNLKLDGQRQVCMSAKIDINAAEPLSDIRIEKGAGNFVSDAMIGEALKGATMHGLDGYSPATLNVVKLTAVPPLARHFRPLVEEAVQKSMADAFQKQISTQVQLLGRGDGSTQINTPTNSFISEMGIGNVAVKKYVDLMDCALLKNERRTIPPKHPCLSQLYPPKDDPISAKDIPTPVKAAGLVQEQMERNDQVTSESLRKRLLEFEPRMSGALSGVYASQIKPLAEQIGSQQLQSNLLSGFQLFSRLGEKDSLKGFGISVAGICDINDPSAHASRKIEDCSMQTYVDLDELNRLMKAMYESGRLCHQGKGNFVPELDAKGEQARNKDGTARGKGCLFRIEETENGMRCFLNGPPELKYDKASGGYRVKMNTKECFRGAVAAGIGKIGGDINFDIKFEPNICDGGDFCLQNGDADWNVVPGTERYALRESSIINGIVKSQINKKLNEVIGQTIRLPLSATSGPMAAVPLQAEGRIDKGEGFFGACLKLKE